MSDPSSLLASMRFFIDVDQDWATMRPDQLYVVQHYLKCLEGCRDYASNTPRSIWIRLVAEAI